MRQSDSCRRVEQFLGWLAVAAGTTMLISPETATFDYLENVAPMFLWGILFVFVGVTANIGASLDCFCIRVATMIIMGTAWGCLSITYTSVFLITQILYPTHALSLVCMIHCAVSIHRLWKLR